MSTFARIMSALPPKAAMCAALAHVCFGPKADMAAPSITSSAHLTVWVSFQTASGKNRAQIKEKCRISPGFHQDRRPNRGYVCLASMREPAEHVPQSLSYPNE